MIPIPWRLIGAAVAIGLLVWGGLWLVSRVRISYQAEQERDLAVKTHASYKAAVQEIAASAAQRMELDALADASLAEQIETLDAERARLAAALSRINPVTEKPDANGRPVAHLRGDWWVCVANFVVRDPAITAACEANAGNGSVPNAVGRRRLQGAP